MKKIKKIFSVILLVLLLTGTGAGFFLFQQNQDIRQQASVSASCGTSNNSITCEARPGCNWEVPKVECGANDCSGATKKDGCNIKTSNVSCSGLDLNSCKKVGCNVLSAVTANCGNINNPSQCNAADGCNWGGDARTCSLSDCASGYCTYTPESRANCSLSTCWRSECNCTTTTTPAKCVGPGLCSNQSVSNCSAPCSIVPAKTTTTANTSQTYLISSATCSTNTYYVNNRCKGNTYTVTPAKCDPNDTYQGNGVCSGKYDGAGSCTGTPEEYCSQQMIASCEEQGTTCNKSFTGGSCGKKTAEITECSQGEFDCVDSANSRYCKTDGTWSASEKCKTGTSCNNDSGKCETDPEKETDTNKQLEQDPQCYSGITSCPTGTVKSDTCDSSCAQRSGVCCVETKTDPVDNCALGNNYCNPNNENQVNICQTDPNSGDKNYISKECAAGKYCPAGGKNCVDVPEEEQEINQEFSSCSELGAVCCFNDQDYTVSCDNGLIPNSENPSECRCRAPYTECNPGEKACNGSVTIQCSSAGKWVELKTCSNRCSLGSCVENLTDGTTCLNNEDCASKNCQSVPGARICAPSGQSLGLVQAGQPCGTNSYDRNCIDGYLCTNNICKAKNYQQCNRNDICISNLCQNNLCINEVLIDESKLAAGLSCEADNQCQSGSCITSEYGWKECAEIRLLVDVGFECGTNAYNQVCKNPYQCINYICKLPVDAPPAPFEEYLEENQGLLSSEAERPTWGEAAKYVAASAANGTFNTVEVIATNPGDVGGAVALGTVDHFGTLIEQAGCGAGWDSSEVCQELTTSERVLIGLNTMTFGGVKGLVDVYLNGGQAAMMNQYGYDLGDPRRWVDNAELGIAVTGFVAEITSPLVNPEKLADAPISSTYDRFFSNSTSDFQLNYIGQKNFSTSGRGSYHTYTNDPNYGPLPPNLELIDPNLVHSVQADILDSLKIQNPISAQEVIKRIEQDGIKVSFVNDIAGASRPVTNRIKRILGTKAEIEIPSIDYLNKTVNFGNDPLDSTLYQLHILGHESGHVYDVFNLDMKWGIEDAWKTEVRQQVFSAKFYKEIGSSYFQGTKDFLDIIKSRTNVIKIN